MPKLIKGGHTHYLHTTDYKEDTVSPGTNLQFLFTECYSPDALWESEQMWFSLENPSLELLIVLFQAKIFSSVLVLSFQLIYLL